jgi:hypothetical protein
MRRQSLSPRRHPSARWDPSRLRSCFASACCPAKATWVPAFAGTTKPSAALAVIPAHAGIHLDSAVASPRRTARQKQHGSQRSLGRRNPLPALAVIPAPAGIHLDSAVASPRRAARQKQHGSQRSPGRRNPPPALAVIPAHAGIHLDSAVASPRRTARQKQHGSQCSPGRRNPLPALAVIPAHAGIHLDSALASLGLYCQAKATRVPVFAGTTNPFAWNMQLTRAPTRCGHFFATHLDSIAPQRVPPLIHMLIDRPSTPGVDNPDTDPSPPGQKFATHLDRLAAQGVDAVIHMVSQTRSTRHVDKPERGTCDRPL